MVAGIVVFGIVATIVSSLLQPLSKQSFDPLWQTRAAEISQSLINEISAKAFDENSDLVGGSVRCNETSAPACTDDGPDASCASADAPVAQTATSDDPFRWYDATYRRNAFSRVLLAFGKDEQVISFVQEVHIPNVP